MKTTARRWTDKAAIDAKTEALANRLAEARREGLCRHASQGRRPAVRNKPLPVPRQARKPDKAQPHDDNVVDAEFKEVNDKK
ncbi:hypothetical protein ACU4GD_35730 [Cupriavidus basilensis]